MPQTFTIPDYIRHEAEAQGLDPAIALGIAEKESSFDPTAIAKDEVTHPDGSKERAVGTFQFLPSTAKARGFDPHDPQANIHEGVRYLKELLQQHQDPYKALQAYGGAVKTDYASDALKRIKKYQLQGTGTTSKVGTPPPIAPPLARDKTGLPTAPPGFDESHPWLSMVSDVINDEKIPEGTPWPEYLQRKAGSTVAKVLQEGTRSLNPVNIVEGLKTLVTTPPAETVSRMWEANKRLREQGQQLLDQADQSGDLGTRLEGVARYGEGLIPLVGPQLGKAHDLLKEGEYARAAGTGLDVAGQVLGPKLLGRSRVAPAIFASHRLPEEAAAVAQGTRAGVNIDLGVTTGNRFARNIQHAAEATPIGAAVQGIVRQGRPGQLGAMGEDLASQIHPTPVAPEVAGGMLQQGTGDFAAQAGQDARAAYQVVEQAAADPQFTQVVQTGTRPAPFYPAGGAPIPIMEAIQAPVDLRAVKAALRPVRDQIRAGMSLFEAQNSRGLVALDNILGLRDYEPLIVTEHNLGAVKAVARGAEHPAFTTIEQGTAGRAVGQLQTAVDTAVQQLGPQAVQALQDGRALTRTKWAAQDIFNEMDKTGAVGAFEKAVGTGDRNFEILQELQRTTPQALPEVGRAVLDKIFAHARSLEQGWSRAAGTAAKWEAIGPQTKQLLFGNRVQELNRFFLLQKMMAELANPSGTALVGTSVGTVAAYLYNPFSALLGTLGSGAFALLANSPGGVRLLTEGLTIRAGTAQAAAWTAAATAAIRQEQAKQEQGQVGAPPPERPAAAAAPTQVGMPPPAAGADLAAIRRVQAR